MSVDLSSRDHGYASERRSACHGRSRFVVSRSEKPRRSAEIVFHVERRTGGRWSRDERQGGHPVTLDDDRRATTARRRCCCCCTLQFSDRRHTYLSPPLLNGTLYNSYFIPTSRRDNRDLRYAGYDRFSTVSDRTLQQIEQSTGD